MQFDANNLRKVKQTIRWYGYVAAFFHVKSGNTLRGVGWGTASKIVPPQPMGAFRAFCWMLTATLIRKER